MTLTPSQRQAVNIAIAEACGWVRPYPTHPNCWTPPTGAQWQALFRREEGKGRWLKSYPDFCDDLNAMAQAEATLTEGQKVHYVSGLTIATLNQGLFASYFATAAQRALAFLSITRPEFQLPE